MSAEGSSAALLHGQAASKQGNQAGRARSKGGSSPCSPGQAARLRVGPVPRREGRRAYDPALPAWSRVPHDGTAPENRQAGERAIRS